MAKARKVTFGSLNRTLAGLGFTAIKTSDHIVFRHRTGRPVILLPEYKSTDTIQPIHQMMVMKQLTDSGVVKLKNFNNKLPMIQKKKSTKAASKHKST